MVKKLFLITFLLCSTCLIKLSAVELNYCANPFPNSQRSIIDSQKKDLLDEIRNSILFYYVKNKFNSNKSQVFQEKLKDILYNQSDSDFYWEISVLVNNLNNNHTFFIPKGFKNSFGIYFQNSNKENIITKVDTDLAEKINIGDRIISVNGQTCLSGNFNFQKNSVGDFSLMQSSDNTAYHLKLKSIFEPAIEKMQVKIEADYIYVKIPSFSEKGITSSFFDKVNIIKDKKPMIIDLRGNSGGYLSEVMNIAKYFFDGSIGYFNGGLFGNKEIKISRDSSLFEKIGQLFLIVDGETFSAAEIFAYLLRSRVNARIIGQSTKGGLESSLTINMPEGSVLSVANSEYCDKNICFYGKKIDPDFVLKIGTPIEKIISTIKEQIK